MGNGPASEVPSIVKDLSEAFNLHIKTCNRVWLSIAALSIAVVPQVLSQRPGAVPTFNIPFDIGKLEANQYTYFGLLVALGGLLIYFCQSWAQAMQVHRKAHEVIAALDRQVASGQGGLVKPSQFYEFLRVSTFTRGGPLLHLMSAGKNHIVKHAAFSLFFLPLRVITFVFVIGLPVGALSVVFFVSRQAGYGPAFERISLFVFVFSCLSALIIAIEEARQTLIIKRHLMSTVPSNSKSRSGEN